MGIVDYLDLRRLAVGVFVEYLDGTSTADSVTYMEAPPPQSDRLWHGHPGIVREAVVQHVLVDWAGLEQVSASLWVGYSCDYHGVYGLGVLTADEYERRRRRVLAGEPPS